MNDKTIKELAVELTVETTAVCDSIKGRADFIHKLEMALKECFEQQVWNNPQKTNSISYNCKEKFG